MSISPAQLKRLVQSLQRLAGGYWGQDRDVQTRVQTILDRFTNTTVTVTFGGHFNAGKSTLINALIRRRLLPVAKYADTGTICILHAGKHDRAEIVDSHGRRTICCTRDALAAEISLRQPSEKKNSAEQRMQQIKQIDITLAGTMIPANVYWIDTPGINHTEIMQERAYEAAFQGDVLIWVLTSKQVLSLTEQKFLTNYIAEHGPAAVFFVLNVFLSHDRPRDWNIFLTDSFPFYKEKLFRQERGMGFTEQFRPEIVPLSARALGKRLFRPKVFDGKDLYRRLQNLHTSDHYRILHSRLFQTTNALRNLAASTKDRLERERKRIQNKQHAFASAQKEAALQKQRFTAEVEKTVSRFLLDWSQQANICATNLDQTIKSGNIARDNTYSLTLSRALKKVAAQKLDTLLARIATLVREYRQTPLSSACAIQLREMLMPPDISVTVANNAENIGAAAVRGAIKGTTIFPVVGTLIGAMIGIHSANKKDAEETKANIANTTQDAIKAVCDKQRMAVTFVVEQYWKFNLRPPDTTELQRLETLFLAISALVASTEQLIRGNILL